MKKKLLSVLAVFAMALTLLTTVAFAEQASAESSTWTESPAAAVEITSAKEITVSNEITFDNSKTLTINSSSQNTDEIKFSGEGSLNISEGTLTVTKGTLVLEGKVAVTGTISLAANDGILKIGEDTYTGTNTTGVVTVSGTDTKTVTVSSGGVKLAGNTASVTLGSGAKAQYGTSAEITGSSGTVTVSKGAADNEAKVTGAGKVTVNSKGYTTEAGTNLNVGSSDSEVELLAGSVTLSDSATVKAGDGGTAAFSGDSVKLTYKNSDEVDVESGTVEVPSGGKANLKGTAKAKVGTSGEIQGAGITVEYSDSNKAKVTGTGTAEIGGKSYTLGGSSELTVESSGATVTLIKGSVTLGNEAVLKVGVDNTYTAGSDSPKVTLSGSDGKLESGTITLTAGKITTSEATNGIKSEGSETTVKAEVDKTTVTATSTNKITVDTAEYTPTSGATLEITSGNNVKLAAGDVELSDGAKVTLGAGTSAKNVTDGKKISGDGATVTGGSDSATVEGNAKVTVNDDKNYTLSDGGKITIADSSSAATLTAGSVTVDAGTAVTFNTSDVYTAQSANTKLTVGGSDLKLESGSVKVPTGKDVKIGDTTITVTGENVTVASDGTVTGLTGTDKIAVKGTQEITVNGVKYKTAVAGESGYTVTYTSDTESKLTPEADKAVTVTFTATGKTVEIDAGTVKSGETNIEGKKISGETAGVAVTVTKTSTEAKVTGKNGEEISEAGKVTAKPGSTSTPSSGSSTPSTTVDKPTTDAASGETKVDVTANSTTTGTTAKATVSDTNMDKAVNSAVAEAAKQGTAPVVEVEVKTSDKADSLNVTLPAASLEKLAEAEDASLVITSDIAQVALDNTALTALAGKAAGDTVTLEVAPVAASALSEAQAEAAGEAPVVDLSLVSNGVAIHDYNNGKITVTLPYKLTGNEDATSVRVFFLDDDGALTPCDTSYADGKVTFVTVHLSKYVIADKSLAPVVFVDVASGAWYAGAVNYAVKHDLMKGTDDTHFAPDTDTTRAMVVTILYRLAGEPEAVNAAFSDVAPGAYYAKAVAWAAANGIVDGYGDGKFGPNDTVTRQQMAAILYRYAGYKGYDITNLAGLTGYADAASVSEWASAAMRWAVAEGLIEGTSATTLSPSGGSTRAQAAAILMRFCESIVK